MEWGGGEGGSRALIKGLTTTQVYNATVDVPFRIFKFYFNDVFANAVLYYFANGVQRL